MRVPVLRKAYDTPTLTIPAGTHGVFSEGAWWFTSSLCFTTQQINELPTWFGWVGDGTRVSVRLPGETLTTHISIEKFYDLLEAEKESRGIR